VGKEKREKMGALLRIVEFVGDWDRGRMCGRGGWSVQGGI